ncbi:hypothetical protein NKH77_34390 [Streptomyces sp. M19]
MLKDKDAMERSLTAPQPYQDVVSINMDRVRDKRVREAIAWAFPSGQYLAQYGGPKAGEIAGGLVAPTLIGYDPPSTRSRSASTRRATPRRPGRSSRRRARRVRADLRLRQRRRRPGRVPGRRTGHGARRVQGAEEGDRPVDLVHADRQTRQRLRPVPLLLGADWPSGSTVVPPVYGGANVYDGSSNYSHMKSPAIDKEIARIDGMSDATTAAEKWIKLSEKVLVDEVPAVPAFANRMFTLWGPGLGGVKYNPVYGAVDPTAVFVR